LALFDEHRTRNIIVVSRSGVQYCVNRDIVETCEDDFVYGYFINRNFRRKGTFRWFSLRNMRFVSPRV
jgi:hypothetical protein